MKGKGESMIWIVTDNTNDLPQSMIEEYQIQIVPLHLTDEKDNVIQIEYDEMLARMEKWEMFKTSLPSPGQFVEAYDRIFKSDPDAEIIVITIASGISGTNGSANTAVPLCVNPEKVHVYDSGTSSLALGLLVLKAAEMAKAGSTFKEIDAFLQEKIDKTFIVFIVSDIRYLERTGRVSHMASMIGTLIKLKPILHSRQKEIHLRKMVLGTKKALKELVKIAMEQPVLDRRLGITTAGPWHRQELVDALKDKFELIVSNMNPILTAHGGPGVASVNFILE